MDYPSRLVLHTAFPMPQVAEAPRPQGELFNMLPRRLPLYKRGPEDDTLLLRATTSNAPPAVH